MIIKIHGKSYDIENYLHLHPGGSSILKLCKNEPDSTALFESYHVFCNRDKINKIMKKYEINYKNTLENKKLFKFEEKGFYKVLLRGVLHFLWVKSS